MTKEECKRRIQGIDIKKVFSLGGENLFTLTAGYDEELVRLLLYKAQLYDVEAKKDGVVLAHGSCQEQMWYLIRSHGSDINGCGPDYFDDIDLKIRLGEDISLLDEISNPANVNGADFDISLFSSETERILSEKTQALQMALTEALNQLNVLRDVKNKTWEEELERFQARERVLLKRTDEAMEEAKAYKQQIIEKELIFSRQKEELMKSYDVQSLADKIAYKKKITDGHEENLRLKERLKDLEDEVRSYKKNGASRNAPSQSMEAEIAEKVMAEALELWTEDEMPLKNVSTLFSSLKWTKQKREIDKYVKGLKAPQMVVKVKGPLNDIHDNENVKAGL